MNYSQVVALLESKGIMPDRPPSLEPTRTALRKLGFYEWPFWKKLKEDPARCIVVAGTNGKGSVCASLEALLISAGERTGLYTSPHLVETTERFRIEAQDISHELFCRAYLAVDDRTRDVPLTHFEWLTLMAAWIFCSGEAVPAVDRLILEVGLGGLWDATNAIPHGVSVITAIGRDHENLLGKTLPEIASNKFGIISPRSDFLPQGMRVFHHPLPDEIKSLARSVREGTESRWQEAVSVEYHFVQTDAEPMHRIRTPWGETNLSLPGPRGAQNAGLALSVFQGLGFNPAEHLSALSTIRWPARMERVRHPRSPCPLYVSGDHNPQGVESLIELLPAYPRKHLHLLVGIGQDKDCAGILERLQTLPDSTIYLTETPFRGRKISDYGKFLSRAREACSDPENALARIFELASPEDMILVTGSLYLAGYIKHLLLNK